MMNNKIALTVIAVSLALVGCGGGGGSSTSPVTPPAPPAPPAPAPPAPAPVVQPASTQAPVAANYGATSMQRGTFDALAAFRTSLGLGPLNQSTSIDIAAANHANYVHLNSSGATPHTEVVGNPGFTGASAQDRIIAAGYGATSASEVIGWTGPAASDVINGLVGTVYHRVPLMMEHWTDVGIAGAPDGFVVIDLGARAAFVQRAAGNFIGVYPADNQSNVALNHGPESPSPFADTNGTAASFCSKGYPVSIMSQGGTKLSVTSFTITEEGAAAPMQSILFTKDSDANGLVMPNMAFLVANSGFKPNTTYIVRFIGSAAGSATGAANDLMAIDTTWRFVTRVNKAAYCN